MSNNALQNVSKIEGSLWEAADQLRANSRLTGSEYCVPVPGLIFLRHSTEHSYKPSRPIGSPGRCQGGYCQDFAQPGTYCGHA